MTVVVLTAPEQEPLPPQPPASVWHETRHLLIMPDDTAYEISDSSTGVALTSDGITGMNDPDWDLFSSDSPILHGTRFHGYRAPEREVVLPLFIYHDESSAAWTERYRAFKQWLSPRHVIRWRVEHPESGEARTLHMRYVGPGNAETTLDSRLEGWKLMSLHFVADERPFWEGDAISRSWRQAEPVDFFDPDGSPPFHVSQSSLLGEAVVRNPGDEPVWPVWTADDGDFDSVTVGVDGRVVQAPIEVRQPQPVDVAVNGDGSSTDGRSVVGENLARNPRGRNHSRQTLVSNLVTNPRGRPANPDTDADPLAARQALLDALAAYTDAPVQWSATEPGDTSVVWVDPVTGEAREWTPEWERLENLVPSPRNRADIWVRSVTYSAEYDAARLSSDDLSGQLEIPGMGNSAYAAVRIHLLAVEGEGQEDPALVRIWRGGGPHQGLSVPVGGSAVATVSEFVNDSLYVLPGPPGTPPERTIYFRIMVAFGDTEEEALALVDEYGDGDSPGWQWDGTPHESTSHRPAREPGWYPIEDPDVVAAGQAYADAITALAPVGWDGAGLWWSAEHDAVYVPAGVSATLPTDGLDGSGTLTVQDVDVIAGPISYHTVTAPVTLPPADEDRYVRVQVAPGPYDGPYKDGDSTPEPETVVEWDGDPHESASRITALVPDEWGEGVRYGEVDDAVFIPAGVAAYPATEPADGGTLVVRDLTAGTITRQPIDGQARLPASDRGRYVRVMATSTPLFRGPYLDEHTWDGDPDLTLEWAGDEGGSGFQLTAPCPQDWDGEGVYYSETRQAVFVPAGVEVAVQADGIGELVIDSSQGSYRAPFEGVIPSATTDRYLSFAVMQPTGDPVSLVLDARPGPRGKSAYVHSGDEAARRTGDLTRREWAPIPPGESVPVSLDMVGNGRVTVTITPLFSEAY